ncbi:hypothetical protein JCM6882_006278 [Rhodosporidiobolus microsporus]
MAAVPTFERVVRRNNLLQLEHPARLRERQLDSLVSSFFEAPTTTTTPANEPSTTPEPTTTSSQAPSPTTTPPSSTTTTTTSERTTTTSEPESTTTSAPESTTSTRSRSSSSSEDADTTVTNVITPTTVIVVGTSTITSALDPVTSASTRSLAPSSGASSSSSGGLSTGAKIGIGVGAGVGGALVLAVLAFACLGLGRRKKNKDEAIVWPAIADSAALYPEPVHNTRAGFGVGDDEDEGDQHSGGTGPSMAEAGAGAAGVGAAGMLGRGYGSQSNHGHHNQPTLPQFPASVYAADQPYNGYYGAGGDNLAQEGSSAYTGYSTATPSQQSHAPLAPGPASVGYGRSQDRHSPSPPRTTAGSGSADGHTQEGGNHLPFPGEPDEELADAGRPISPTPMQVGDTFGSGYDESEGGRRWRLSVVNDDPRDRD